MIFMEIVTHANLIIGDDSAAVADAAKGIAMTAVCANPIRNGSKTSACGVCRDCRKAIENIHPDIITISKLEDKKEFTVDLVRAMITEAQFVPTEGAKKVFLLPDAAAMNTNAANAFLKLLEEPPEWVVFVLMGKRLSDFLQTICSRCNIIRATSGSNETIQANTSADNIFTAFSQRNAAGVASECMKIEKLKRDELQAVLDVLFVKFAQAAQSDTRFIAAADKVFEPLSRLRGGLNLGAGHVAGLIMVDLTQLII